MENNDKENKFLKGYEKIAILILTLLMTLTIFIIAVWVKSYETTYKSSIALDNWLLYYGTISGTLIGGAITAIGLFFTFKINASQFEEQRRIDNMRWKNSNRQFNQQMKIQIINEKISDYKKCIESINQFINDNARLSDAIDEYYTNIKIFIKKLDNLKLKKESIKELNLKYNKDIPIILEKAKIDSKAFDLSSMSDSIGKSLESSEIIKMSSKCIAQQNIVDNIEIYVRKFNDAYDKYYIAIGKFLYKNNFSTIPQNYFKNDEKMYNEIMEKRKVLENNVSEYKDIIKQIKYDLLKEKSYIQGEIGKLYMEKYNLNKEDNEQKTSNNN